MEPLLQAGHLWLETITFDVETVVPLLSINRPAMPAPVSFPPAQNANSPAAQISGHVRTSEASVSAPRDRSCYSSLRKFIASLTRFGGESVNNDASTPEGIQRYKASVQMWTADARSYGEIPHRKQTEKSINAWLNRNNPEAPLDLSGLLFKDFPPLPSTLQRLEARGTLAEKLPENLPSGLTSLDVSRTPLAELPENLPSGLVFLDISHTEITEIPESLRQAMSRETDPCVVRSEGSLIVGLLNGYRVGRLSPTLAQAVQAWYGAPDANRQAAWEKIHQEAQANALADPTRALWALLDSLKGSAEHPSEVSDTQATKAERAAMRAAFKERVTHLLDGIQENENLRLACFNIAHSAVETCHDNVALGFDQMELEHLKLQAEQGKFTPQELARLGGGTFKLALLDELAKKKARQSGNQGETVEVVLAYRTMLAAKLDLPIKTKAMRYFVSANITDADLAAAQKTVEEKVNPDSIISFLTDWAPWQKDLERRHPENFDAAAVERGKKTLHDKVNALLDTYDQYVEAQGEDSEAALDTLGEINALGGKFNALEQDLFRAARERLTKAFVTGQFPASS